MTPGAFIYPEAQRKAFFPKLFQTVFLAGSYHITGVVCVSDWKVDEIYKELFPESIEDKLNSENR